MLRTSNLGAASLFHFYISMDIKVITRHAPSNYGSLLQAIATIHAFESLGHRCSIIDYQRPDERGLKGIIAEMRNKPRWNKNLLSRCAYIAMRAPGSLLAQSCFDKWRNMFLPTTHRVTSHQQLDNIHADLLVTGSDQVWGPVAGGHIDTAYFLDFGNVSTPRIAYAASFGRNDSLPLDTIAGLLARYRAVTVRESSAAKIISDMNLPEPSIVADPTLLLSRQDWMGKMGLRQEKTTKPYILVYQLHNNDAVNNFAKAAASRLGLPLKRVSPYIHQCARPGRFSLLPSPAKFIKLIDEATLMITDSFHGTAFAINCGTQFVDILPNNGTATRNRNILRSLGLDNRIVHDTESLSLIDRHIDYAIVHEKVKKLRENSIAALRDMICRCEDK